MNEMDLAILQNILLEQLLTREDSAAVLQALQQDQALQNWADYLNTFQPEMMEVAAALVKKWGKRSVE